MFGELHELWLLFNSCIVGKDGIIWPVTMMLDSDQNVKDSLPVKNTLKKRLIYL